MYPLPGWKKLGACLAMLIGALAGALAGAALGSLLGPGGTLIGSIKGAIEGGGLAKVATFGVGTLGAIIGSYIPYYFCGRNTLFTSPLQKLNNFSSKDVKLKPPDENREAIIRDGKFLVTTLNDNLPKLRS